MLLATAALNIHRSLFSSSLESNFSSTKACFFTYSPQFNLDIKMPDYFTEEDRKFRTNMPSDAVALADVKAVTLQAGKFGTGKRTAPAPQLICVGGSAKRMTKFHPKLAQCYNQGWDGSNYNWKLESQLDPSVKLGNFEVIYEGYRGAGDPQFALKGSWSVEYHLEKTGLKPSNKGSSWWSSQPSETHKVEYYTYRDNHGFFYHVFRFIRGVFILTIVVSILGGISTAISDSIDYHHKKRQLKRMMIAQRLANAANPLPPTSIYDVNRAGYYNSNAANYEQVLRDLEREERRRENKLWWKLFWWNLFTTPAAPTTTYVYQEPRHWWEPTHTTYVSPAPVVRETHIYRDNSSSTDNDRSESTSTSYGTSRAR